MQNTFKKLQRRHKTNIKRFKRWNKHPHGLPITIFFVLVIFGVLLGAAFRHHGVLKPSGENHLVIVTHDGEKQFIPTNAQTVGSLIQKLKLRIGQYDRVEPALSTEIVEDNIRVNIYRAVPVTLIDNGVVSTSYSAATTPRSIAAQSGKVLYAEDLVTAAPAQNLIDQKSLGQVVTINRAVPITLNDYGTILSLRTHATTVAQLLSDNNIHLKPQDSVLPVVSTVITPNVQVFVVRKGTQIVSATQSIPAPIQTVTDASLSFGTSAVRQQGSAGSEVLTYQVNTQNGKEVSRTLLQTVVTVQPVTQIVAHGLAVSIPSDKQAVMAQAGISSSDYPYVDYIASHEGGWCPTKIQGTHDCPGYMDPANVPSYGGYGIFQATPGRKMASAGGDWATSAATQIRWATGYANARYGSWEGAYNHWVNSHNW